jgi:cytochrome oxidase Cu insertion factor (SCO1/SenC/PrrC family)
MRGRPLIGVVVGVIMLAGSVAARADDLGRELLEGLRLNLPVATAAPPLALKRLDSGRTLTLQDLRGRPVLLYFWATW